MSRSGEVKPIRTWRRRGPPGVPVLDHLDVDGTLIASAALVIQGSAHQYVHLARGGRGGVDLDESRYVAYIPATRGYPGMIELNCSNHFDAIIRRRGSLDPIAL